MRFVSIVCDLWHDQDCQNTVQTKVAAFLLETKLAPEDLLQMNDLQKLCCPAEFMWTITCTKIVQYIGTNVTANPAFSWCSPLL